MVCVCVCVCGKVDVLYTSLIICRAWHFLQERRRDHSPSTPSFHPLITGLIYYTERRQGLLEVPFPPIINRWLVWNRRHRLFFTKTPDRRYARARWACRTNDKSTWATTATATTDAVGESLSTIHKLPWLHSDFAHKFTYIYHINIYGIQRCVCACAYVCKTPWITNFYITWPFGAWW